MWSSEKKKLLIALDSDLYDKLSEYATGQKRSIVNSIVYLIEKQLAQTNQTNGDSNL